MRHRADLLKSRFIVLRALVEHMLLDEINAFSVMVNATILLIAGPLRIYIEHVYRIV